MRISDWSSDVCSSDLNLDCPLQGFARAVHPGVAPGEVEGPRDRGIGTRIAGIEVRRLLEEAPRMQRGLLGEAVDQLVSAQDQAVRSEERRVGKEGVRTCRSRW